MASGGDPAENGFLKEVFYTCSPKNANKGDFHKAYETRMVYEIVDAIHDCVIDGKDIVRRSDAIGDNKAAFGNDEGLGLECAVMNLPSLEE